MSAPGGGVMMTDKERILEGNLKKKSPKGFLAKVWQTRYFVLYDDMVEYYKSKSDRKPAGTIPLHAISEITSYKDKKSGARFDLVVGDPSKDKASARVFSLLAENEADCNRWVEQIRKCKQALPDDAQNWYNDDGKFWKRTEEIREQREHRKSSVWGDRMLHALDDDEDDAPPVDAGQGVAELYESKDEVGFDVVQKVTADHFGQVYTVRHRPTKVVYLMHVYPKNDAMFPVAQQLFNTMQTLEHPYIFQLVHRGETCDTAFAVYTLAVDESLYCHLRNHKRLPVPVAGLFIAEVVLALGYLHSHGHCFRNMRAENIFLDAEGHAVVSDLLLCLPPQHRPPHTEPAEYKTPESIQGSQEDRRADWWRLGVLAYELTAGIPPFRKKPEESLEDLHNKIRNHTAESLRFPPWVDQTMRDFICALLHVDPNQRLGGSQDDMAAVKAHPFFASVGIDWNLLETRQMVSPEYVDTSLQEGRRSQNAVQGITVNPTKNYEFHCRLVEARSLPGLNINGVTSDAYCVLQCENTDRKSSVVRDSATPTWNQSFVIPIQDNETNTVTVNVFHDSAGHAQLIGTVELKLAEVQINKVLDKWYSIVGSDSIVHGELHLDIAWRELPERRKMEPPTSTVQTFDSYFLQGLTV